MSGDRISELEEQIRVIEESVGLPQMWEELARPGPDAKATAGLGIGGAALGGAVGAGSGFV